MKIRVVAAGHQERHQWKLESLTYLILAELGGDDEARGRKVDIDRGVFGAWIYMV